MKGMKQCHFAEITDVHVTLYPIMQQTFWNQREAVPHDTSYLNTGTVRSNRVTFLIVFAQ